MQTFILLAGVVLVLFAVTDALMTTLSTSRRAGPLTQVVTASVWRGALAIHRRRPVHGLLTAVGPLLVVLSLLLWMLLLWSGWALVLGSQDGAVVSSPGKDPAGWVDRFYFAGMSLISLGTGDLVGSSPGWRVLSVVATGTGMFVLTLALSYFVSVVSAATQARALAAQLLALGRTPQDMVLRAWDGEQVSSSLPTVLSDLGQQLSSLAEQHLTYHVLHHFHARDPRRAALVGIARLDEAIGILEHGVTPDRRPDPLVLRMLRAHVDRIVEVVTTVHVTGGSEEAPPTADLTPLRLAEIPVVDEASYAAAMAHLAPRRRKLEALVRGAGWSWDEVGTPPEAG